MKHAMNFYPIPKKRWPNTFTRRCDTCGKEIAPGDGWTIHKFSNWLHHHDTCREPN